MSTFRVNKEFDPTVLLDTLRAAVPEVKGIRAAHAREGERAQFGVIFGTWTPDKNGVIAPLVVAHAPLLPKSRNINPPIERDWGHYERGFEKD